MRKARTFPVGNLSVGMEDKSTGSVSATWESE
jgi:hypothetical protein